MTTYQNPLTIIAPVKPSELNKLRHLLKSIQYPDVEANLLVPFYKMRSIHFARFVIIDSEDDRFPVQLAFSSNYDRDEKAHIAELVSTAKDGLEQIYRCCIGFADDLESYWADHKVSANAFYIGHPGIWQRKKSVVKQGNIVFASILSVMFDEEAFTNPNEFRTDRTTNYLHFGHGMHTCYGRHINAITIPEMTSALLRLPCLKRADGKKGKPVYAGPFPDYFVLEFDWLNIL